MSTTDVAALIGAIAGPLAIAIPATLAWRQYQHNSRVQRAQWLVGLFERFYEKNDYREVRRHVEWLEEDDVRSAISDDPDLEQKWTDYLNFFELIAYLQDIGQLRMDDIDAMFGYWIDRLSPFEGYLKEYNYENLVRLLERRGLPEERE